MNAVNIQQLWSRAWDLFKGNWLLLVGLLVLYVIVNLIFYILIPIIGNLIASILLWPAFVRAGYLVARQGQLSSGEVFGDISLLLKVFVYDLILGLIPEILIRVGYMQDSYPAISILIVAGLITLFILSLFGWAGPYAILSGRAGIFSAIGQSFSLTWRNFSKVFEALLFFMGLAILGLLLCGVGLLVVTPILYVFMPLLYFALTGEEGVSHS